MKNNKMYIPADAISKHEDFDVWYADGALGMHFEGPWEKESDKIALIGRLGGQNGQIRPDNKTLDYYLKFERWEYTLQTHHIFKHYFVEGLAWNIDGSMAHPPFDIVNINDDQKAVHVRLKEFGDKGMCYEVKVRDVAYLRIAVLVCVGMLIKEEYKGLSLGETDEFLEQAKGTFTKFNEWLQPKGIKYELLYDEDGNEKEWPPRTPEYLKLVAKAEKLREKEKAKQKKKKAREWTGADRGSGIF